MKKYGDEIMQCVRQNLYLEPGDTSKDDKIMKMPKDEVFERYLNWKAIIGYGPTCIRAVENIWGVKLIGGA